MHVYRGIPFAAPPLGNLRWKPPQPVAPWEGVRDCTAFGLACPQPQQALMPIKADAQSEDCLFLNVWTPAKTVADRLPVMVWIHGGGCTTGAGSLAMYDGTNLARQGVVVVTINYRLGPFGFFAHPLLSAESPRGVSGNYGFLDQIAALQWVRDNIAAFGGDPGCVTIFGESAGSASVARLLISPLAQGLFHRAIAESGGIGRSRHLREHWGSKPMEQVGEEIARALGCTDLAALRAKTAEELLQASNPAQGLFGQGNKFRWVVDGWAIPDDPGLLYAAGKFSDVPLLIGTNANEGSVFLAQLPNLTPATYRMTVGALFGADADAVLKLFPAERDEGVRPAMERLTTVFAFVADARAIARMKSRGQEQAYLYHFTRVPPALRTRGLGAAHGMEIPYVFNNLPRFMSQEDKQLAAAMSACWVQFAKTGNPNAPGLPAWPAYDAADRYLEFGDAITVKSGLYQEACDLYDRIKAKQNLDRELGLGEM
ncbi:MAG: carboxylesterase/lipase family protein [Armatimonadota bacterium]